MITRFQFRALVAAAAALVAALALAAPGAGSPAGLALAAPGTGSSAERAFTVPGAGSPAGRALTHSPAATNDYVPGEVVIRYGSGRRALAIRSLSARLGVLSARLGVRIVVGASPAPGVQVLRLPVGASVQQMIGRIRGLPGVAYAVPNYIAHAAGSWVPDDPGEAHQPGGWEKMQWNFLPGTGVDAPSAWSNLIGDGRPGARGVVIAVLDTGVAYRNWQQFKKSPDFTNTRFVAPYDFVANNHFPLDREGHGTFTAGEIAEATNNGLALTGLAYGATIMPVRVLAADGTGDALTIARGIRYAVDEGAQVINLSLEFGVGIGASNVPDIVSAVAYAHRHGVIVVAAAGNDEAPQIAYPARAPGAIAVGATTRDRCLAWYSNVGPGLDLVAPGGDDDATLPADPDCHPDRSLPPIYQMTFVNPSNPGRFGLPPGIYGTSMAAAQVAATAAMVIASGVLGRHPTPDAILRRLEQTATPLGNSKPPNLNYGYGLLNAGAATMSISPARRRRT